MIHTPNQAAAVLVPHLITRWRQMLRNHPKSKTLTQVGMYAPLSPTSCHMTSHERKQFQVGWLNPRAVGLNYNHYMCILWRQLRMSREVLATWLRVLLPRSWQYGSKAFRPTGPLTWPTGPPTWPTGPPTWPTGPPTWPTGPPTWPTGPPTWPTAPLTCAQWRKRRPYRLELWGYFGRSWERTNGVLGVGMQPQRPLGRLCPAGSGGSQPACSIRLSPQPAWGYGRWGPGRRVEAEASHLKKWWIFFFSSSNIYTIIFPSYIDRPPSLKR